MRNFYNDPSATYLEEPPDRPGQRGYSVHVYNDGGKFGGFGELECNGRSIGGQTGRSASTDVFTLWLYVGATEKIKNITAYMLGVQP